MTKSRCVGHGAQSCWLGSPTGGCKRRRWSCSAFGFVPSTQGSVLGLPTSTCLADVSVLDATNATAPPAGFSHSWGYRMAASAGQDFLPLGVADRRRLEAVYTLLLISSETGARVEKLQSSVTTIENGTKGTPPCFEKAERRTQLNSHFACQC